MKGILKSALIGILVGISFFFVLIFLAFSMVGSSNMAIIAPLALLFLLGIIAFIAKGPLEKIRAKCPAQKWVFLQAVILAICVLVAALAYSWGYDVDQKFNSFKVGRPAKEAQSVLKSAISTRYTPHPSADVQWQKNTAITSLSLAEASGEIDYDHVCVSTGDFTGNAGWSSNGRLVEYTGTNGVKTKIVAYCGTCETSSSTGAPLRVEAGTKLNTTLDPTNCSQEAFTFGDDQTCCIVALVKV